MKVKLYNDVSGHQAGDMALITAANVIRSNMREEDTLIRYGGDEFLMVLPGIGEAEMDMLLDKICKAVYETEVPGYARLRLSASIGGVITGNEPIENAVGRADRLMPGLYVGGYSTQLNCMQSRDASYLL